MQQMFQNIGNTISEYLPGFFGGLFLVILGLALGWLVKRIIIQLAVILRLERFFIRFRWAKDFSKGDVRYGFYSFIGGLVSWFIFLFFLNEAFRLWKLTALSDLLKNALLFIPKLSIALLVLGLGWFIAAAVFAVTQKAFRRERIPRASLIAGFIRMVVLIFFTAMALAELNIAREIVVIGFAVIFITLGVLTIVLALNGGKELAKRMLEPFEDE